MNETFPQSTEVSKDEISQAVETLSRLKPGELPLDIFVEVARLTVTPILEVVPLRISEAGNVQVLLCERED